MSDKKKKAEVSEMELRVVAAPYALQWPVSLAEADGTRFRGEPGYIVDINATMEDVFLEGQDAKLRKLTDREIERYERTFMRPVGPGKIENAMALAAIRSAERGGEYKPLVVAEQIKENEEAAAVAAEADALGIPDPEPSEGEWSKE